MPDLLLPVPHIQQRERADCLAACAAMALACHNVPVRYSRLLLLLNVTPYGTPGRNLNHLSQLGVSVMYAEGSMAGIRALVDQGIPSIVLVRTVDLPHWTSETNHSVVVVGYGPAQIFVNDPAFSDHPLAVPIDDFELAWMAFDYRYAVVRSV